MVEALKTNSTQQQRKLRYNNVGVEGARAVADTLRTSSTLQERNSIHDRSINEPNLHVDAMYLPQ